MAKCTVSGDLPTNDLDAPIPTDEKRPDGQNKDHWVMCQTEIMEKGFKRPIRKTYIHEKCKTSTSMPQSIAETYAADPYYYGSTFCCNCGDYFPVGIAGEFIWEDGTKVGS
jgi:hypothetical protein